MNMRRTLITLTELACTVLLAAALYAQPIASGTAYRIFKRTGTPAACSVGSIVYNLSDTTLYMCSAANTWTAVGGGTVPVTYSGATATNNLFTLKTTDDNTTKQAFRVLSSTDLEVFAIGPTGSQFWGIAQTGTNVAGTAVTVRGPTGTGSALPGAINFQAGGLLSGSGTTQHPAYTRVGIGWSKKVTNNTVTTVFSLPNSQGSGGVVSVTLVYAVNLNDSTDFQVEEGMVSCHSTTKGGVVTNNTCVKFGNQQAVTAGTLTVTWSITTGNLVQININSSLSPAAGYPWVNYTVFNNSYSAIAQQ
jgi:hypothetical protein